MTHAERVIHLAVVLLDPQNKEEAEGLEQFRRLQTHYLHRGAEGSRSAASRGWLQDVSFFCLFLGMGKRRRRAKEVLRIERREDVEAWGEGKACVPG